jgi:hypothetical protein
MRDGLRNQTSAFNDFEGELHAAIRSAQRLLSSLAIADLNSRFIIFDLKNRIMMIYKEHLKNLQNLENEVSNVKSSEFLMCGQALEEFETHVTASLRNFAIQQNPVFAFIINTNSFFAHAIIQVIPKVFFVVILLFELSRRILVHKIPDICWKNYLSLYVLILVLLISYEDADAVFHEIVMFAVNEMLELYGFWKTVKKWELFLGLLDKISGLMGKLSGFFGNVISTILKHFI